MHLVQEYLALAASIVSVKDFKEPKHFKEITEDHNRKATRMREIATEIDQICPEFKNSFCELLSNENIGIRLWVAHHVLEVMNCDQTHRKSALKVIRHTARSDKTANGFGEKVWLKDWYKAHPKDRCLR